MKLVASSFARFPSFSCLYVHSQSNWEYTEKRTRMPSDMKTPYDRLLPTTDSPSLRPSPHSPSASRTASPVPLPPDDQLQDHYAYSTQLHRREPDSIVDFSSSHHSSIPLINDLKHAAQRFTSYDPPTPASSNHSSGSAHSNHALTGGGTTSSYPPQHAAPSSSSSQLTPSAHFSTLSIPQTLSSLSTSSSTGLDAQKVPAIRELSGPNEFEVDAKEPTWKKFLGKFVEDPLILLLLASACVSAVVGNYDDAASILVAVFIVITGTSIPFLSFLIKSVERAGTDVSIILAVPFSSRFRSRTTIGEIPRSAQQTRPSLLPPHSVRPSFFPLSPLFSSSFLPTYLFLPRRNGQKSTVLANVLVPGDLVTFHTGDRIPADIRLTQSHGLEIDESALTGETKPAKKQTEAIVDSGLVGVGGLPIAERSNVAFMGTLVRSGRGEGVVVGTGVQSEFGVVFAMMQEVRQTFRLSSLRFSSRPTQLRGSLCVEGLTRLTPSACSGWRKENPPPSLDGRTRQKALLHLLRRHRFHLLHRRASKAELVGDVYDWRCVFRPFVERSFFPETD